VSVSPDAVDLLARTVLGIAQDAELSLAGRIADALRRGIDGPGWAQRQLGDVGRLRKVWSDSLDPYLDGMRTAAGRAVLDAGTQGEALALDSLRAVLREAGATSALPGRGAVIALAEELSGTVASTRWSVLRSAEDIFRSVVGQVSGRVLLGAQTRRSVAQVALDRLISRGVAGFTDVSGRHWELASYVEMATRTAAQRAMTTAHSETLASRGHDLVIVSNAPAECKLCRPWENKVLSLSGGAGRVTLPSAVDPGELITVEVAGTLAQAQRAGLYHPNCRHSHAAYLPGLTKPAPGEAADPKGDAARQRLRALERGVRAAKLRQAGALDDQARRRAGGDVRAAQAAIREHVAVTPGLLRQPARERVGTAR